MIPCLYTETETQFLTNGIGKLCDASSCYVTEETLAERKTDEQDYYV